MYIDKFYFLPVCSWTFGVCSWPHGWKGSCRIRILVGWSYKDTILILTRLFLNFLGRGLSGSVKRFLSNLGSRWLVIQRYKTNSYPFVLELSRSWVVGVSKEVLVKSRFSLVGHAVARSDSQQVDSQFVHGVTQQLSVVVDVAAWVADCIKQRKGI